MKHNPYSGAQITLANGEHIEDLRFNDGFQQTRSKALSNGEINASNTKDLMGNIQKLLNESSQGNIVTASEASVKRNSPEAKKVRREILSAAAADTTGAKWNQIGVALAAEIDQVASRDGFLRDYCVGEELDQGATPRTRLKTFSSTAIVATSALEVAPQLLRDAYHYPQEFYISASIEIENREINQVNADILDEKYNEGLEAIMVAEDRLWKAAVDLTVGLSNPLQNIAGSLTPTILTQIRDAVTDHGIPAENLLIANDIWSDLIGHTEFHSWIDPVNRYDMVLTGYIGNILGMKIRTDAHRQRLLKVLNAGEIYVVSAPENHANYTTRGPVVATPLDNSVISKNSKGWFLTEDFSLIVSNDVSVAKAVKI